MMIMIMIMFMMMVSWSSYDHHASTPTGWSYTRYPLQ